MTWKSAAQIHREIARYWFKGLLLEPAPDLFPLRIPIPPPAPKEMASRFAEIQDWYRELEAGERGPGKAGYRLIWRMVKSQRIGLNRIPEAALVDTVADAVAIIGRSSEATQYQELLAFTQEACPSLVTWMRSRPLIVISHAHIWIKLIAVVQWFLANPRPNIYLRQVDVPGVDTKFIESWTSVIADLLEEVLLPEQIAREHPPRAFEARYGLRAKSLRVPVRVLDPALSFAGLTEFSAPLEQLATLQPNAAHVLLVENEITALSLPPMNGTLVIHGLGNAVEKVAVLPWLTNKRLWYWGDIDTHGIAILSRLRSFLPQITSILMDEATLLEHCQQWVTEESQDMTECAFLTPAETSLLSDLRSDRYNRRVRLEQERVRWGWAMTVICQRINTV